MRKGPSTCTRYREEFQEDERNDDAFKCKRCNQHPDWHKRLPAPPAAGKIISYRTLILFNSIFNLIVDLSYYRYIISFLYFYLMDKRMGILYFIRLSLINQSSSSLINQK